VKSEKRIKEHGDDDWENERENEGESENEKMAEGLEDAPIPSDKLAETETGNDVKSISDEVS